MRRTLLTIAFIALPHAGSLHAQTFAGLGAGLAIPTGDLGRIDGTGYQLFGAWQSITPLKSTGIRVDASFSAMRRTATIQQITDRIASVTAGPVIRFPRVAIRYGYAIATAGIYNQSTSPAPLGSSPSTDLGVSLGGGIRFSIGGRKAFAEARYHRVMSADGPRFVPVSFGLAF